VTCSSENRLRRNFLRFIQDPPVTSPVDSKTSTLALAISLLFAINDRNTLAVTQILKTIYHWYERPQGVNIVKAVIKCLPISGVNYLKSIIS
jgi:hypothetical protein